MNERIFEIGRGKIGEFSELLGVRCETEIGAERVQFASANCCFSSNKSSDFNLFVTNTALL
jgi:hypothetical protein